MTCDEYYKTHDEWTVTGDRCSVPKIEADSASQIALMSTVTTSCSKYPCMAIRKARLG